MDYDVIVIGAGVVGLACAMKSAGINMKTLVIERHPSFGYETSSRNSQVIHAGMYYPTGSLKAKMCVRGNRSIYAWCASHSVEYRKTGKYIIAVDEDEEPELSKIIQQGLENGVEQLKLVFKETLRKVEPNIRAVAAIWSPQTGIINSHELMESFLHEAQEHNCDFAWQHKVISSEAIEYGYRLFLQTADGEEFSVTTTRVVNACGLEADIVAQNAGMDTAELGYQQEYCRGHYYRIRAGKSHLIHHLIYPVPPKDMSGLGIHVTLDLDGSLKLGPDTEYLEKRVQDYSVSDSLSGKFYSAVSRYINGISLQDIYPDQSGIRPKIVNRKGKFQDFIIREERATGFKNWVNLIGIESPGLTCCLEIADQVLKLV